MRQSAILIILPCYTAVNGIRVKFSGGYVFLLTFQRWEGAKTVLITDSQWSSPMSSENQANGARFKVPDMSCDHCVAAIRKEFDQAMPGTTVAIDLDSKEVAVAGDAAKAEQAIRAAGYEPQQISG
jgi:copper chaperone